MSNDFGSQKFLKNKLTVKLREIDDQIFSQRGILITRSCKVARELGYDESRQKQLLASMVYFRRRALMWNARCFPLMKQLGLNTSINFDEVNSALNLLKL